MPFAFIHHYHKKATILYLGCGKIPMKNDKNKWYIIRMLRDGKTMREKQMFIAQKKAV
jgi:hypothetical protein